MNKDDIEQFLNYVNRLVLREGEGDEEFEDFRVRAKALVHDLEATKRENEYLRRMLKLTEDGK